MYTKLEDNIVKMKYKIEFDAINNIIIIKEYPQRNIIYKGNTYDNDKTLQIQGGLLTDEVGLGKTFSTITHLINNI